MKDLTARQLEMRLRSPSRSPKRGKRGEYVKHVCEKTRKEILRFKKTLRRTLESQLAKVLNIPSMNSKGAERQRLYRLRHPSVERQRYEADREQMLAKTKRRQLADPEYFREITRKHRALKFGLTTWLTAEEWLAIKEKYDNRCLGCRRSEDELHAAGLVLSTDHVIPLERGGTCGPENVQPLCFARKKGSRKGCNNIKHRKLTDFRVQNFLSVNNFASKSPEFCPQTTLPTPLTA